MASGFVCANVETVSYTKTQFASPSAIDDGSTPVIPTPTVAFINNTNDTFVVLGCRLLEQYDGGGVKLRFLMASTATTGSARWVGSIRSTDAGDSITSSFNFVTNAVGVTVATSGTAGNFVLVEIEFTHGTVMNDIAAGDCFQILLWRDQDHAGDDLAVYAHIPEHSFAVLER